MSKKNKLPKGNDKQFAELIFSFCSQWLCGEINYTPEGFREMLKNMILSWEGKLK